MPRTRIRWRVAGFVAVLAASTTACVVPAAPEFTALPDQEQVQREQLVLHTDFRLPRHHRLVEELIALRHDVSERLEVPLSDEPIHVYLFEDADRFHGFVSRHHEQLPERRAFFVESDTQLVVYAHWGDRVAEDLRHELTHGYLHSVVPHLPLWLDEGLAEYHELPRGRKGLHLPHITALSDRYAKYLWKPGLDRLQRFTDVRDMRQIDYAESWLFAHWLMESSPQRSALLRNYLARLRMTGECPPFSRYLAEAEPNYEQELLAHLESLRREVELNDNEFGSRAPPVGVRNPLALPGATPCMSRFDRSGWDSSPPKRAFPSDTDRHV
ncbi:MAG: hypothetical protein FJ297_11380 [Planctomycetes bacterium]|nr:hypothetical protein [Planctomycetota bacterium]